MLLELLHENNHSNNYYYITYQFNNKQVSCYDEYIGIFYSIKI